MMATEYTGDVIPATEYRGEVIPLEGIRTPLQMKTFQESMREELASRSPWERWLAAFGSLPAQMYQGAKQIGGQPDPAAITGLREIRSASPVPAIAGDIASMSLIPGGAGVIPQVGIGTAIGALMPTEGEESRLVNTALGGAVGGGVAGVQKAVSPAMASWISKAQAAAAGRRSAASIRDATIRDAQAEGFVLPPTAIRRRAAATAVESMGGKAAIGQEASLRNQAVIDKIARREASLSPNEPISEATLAKARDVIEDPYRQVAALSKNAASALEGWRHANYQAKQQWHFYNRSGDPKAQDAALKAQQNAKLFHKVMEKEAGKFGRPELIPALREARVRLAKNFDVDRALNIGQGSVDAGFFKKELSRKGEGALSGGLLTIGKFAEAFPQFTRIAVSGQSAPGVSALNPFEIALALGLMGGGGTEFLWQHPYGAALAIAPFLRDPARSFALGPMQRSLPTYQPNALLRYSEAATRNALLPRSAAVETVENQ